MCSHYLAGWNSIEVRASQLRMGLKSDVLILE